VGTGQRAAATLVEIDETRCFVQVADKVAGELTATPPKIPAEEIAVEPGMMSVVAITGSFRSIFAP
jgi:hypothetical protein